MNIVFFVTLAENIKDQTLYRIREHEYTYCLSRVFSYKLPVYGVVSESVKYSPAELFPFQKLLYIRSTEELGAFSKSRKEFVSLKKMINELSIDDNTWIIKISGRYMLVDDTFVQTVKESKKQAIIRQCDDKQMYTFLYAIKFGLYKKIFEIDLDNSTNIEYHILTQLKKLVPETEIEYVTNLGIFSNINNECIFRYL